MQKSVIFVKKNIKKIYYKKYLQKIKIIKKNISYILQFINSARFIESSLSNLLNNLSEEIHRIKCKYGQADKKCETCGIKYKYCICFLEYTNFKDDR